MGFDKIWGDEKLKLDVFWKKSPNLISNPYVWLKELFVLPSRPSDTSKVPILLGRES